MVWKFLKSKYASCLSQFYMTLEFWVNFLTLNTSRKILIPPSSSLPASTAKKTHRCLQMQDFAYFGNEPGQRLQTRGTHPNFKYDELHTLNDLILQGFCDIMLATSRILIKLTPPQNRKLAYASLGFSYNIKDDNVLGSKFSLVGRYYIIYQWFVTIDDHTPRLSVLNPIKTHEIPKFLIFRSSR